MLKFQLHDPSLPRTTIWDSINPKQVTNALQAMPLMDRVCRVLCYAPESYLKTGLLTSPTPDIQKVRELQQMIEDNERMIVGLIGQDLVDEIKMFGI